MTDTDLVSAPLHPGVSACALVPSLVDATDLPGEVQVRTAAGLVPLPKAQGPIVVRGLQSAKTTEAFTAAAGDRFELEVDLGTVEVVLFALPVRAGVVYLVDADTMQTWPQRTDFVTPAAFELVDLDGDPVTVLVRVHRQLPPAAPDVATAEF